MSLLPAIYIPSGGTPVDHLPLPRRPTHTPVEMPYFGEGREYDGGPFLTYPSRQGWSEKDICDPKNSGKTIKETRSFFQIWFFWGLLSDVLRKPMYESDFVRENKYGQKVITTKNFPELMVKWYDREQYLSRRAQERHAIRVDQNLWRFCNIMNWWNVHGTDPFDQSMAIYLIILGEYIQMGYRIVYYKATGIGLELNKICSSAKPFWMSADRRWSSSGRTTINERMAADGWCRSDVQRLNSTLLTAGLFFASMLKPLEYASAAQKSVGKSYSMNTVTEKAVNHGISNKIPNYKHHQCSEFSCSAYLWDEKEYKSKHESEFCTCAHSGVCVSKLIRILETGNIPVICLQNGIQVLPATPGVRYVAISHVWSDGLGNPNTNALPTCQVKNIARLVNGLYPSSDEPIAFWIDTLCCPVQPYSARSQAISLMKKTYQNADKVLVIDSYLYGQPIMQLRAMEILVMVHCSKWNRRLWTLQEQIFACERLHFQFKDMSLRIDNIALWDVKPTMVLLEDLNRLASVNAIYFGASGIKNAVYGDSRLLTSTDVSPARALTIIQRMLPFRATTKASDEAVCLGSLLNLDIQRILSAPEAVRMETFWSEMPSIPPNVIFWIGPKLQKKGFRWAPSTFLNGRDLTRIELADTGTAQLTQKGLRVCYPGWMLGCQKGFHIRAQFYCMDTSEILYMVSCLDGESRRYLPRGSSLDPWSLEPEQVWQSTLHIILQFDLDDAGNNGPKVCHDAILVLAYGIYQENLLVRSVCPVTVRKLEVEAKETQSWRNCARSLLVGLQPHIREMGLWSSSPKFQLDSEAIDLMGCSAVTKDHPWCVD